MSNQEQFLKSQKYADLCTAIKRGDKSAVRQLILRNADVNINCKSSLNTPLHWAVIKSEDTKLIKILLGKKANVHAINYRQQTPLDIAVQLGKADAVKLFLSNGAYAMNNIKSLIYTATEKINENIVKLLVDYTAINHPSINLKKSLKVAVEKGLLTILQYIIPYCKFKKSSDKFISPDAIYGKGQEYKDCISFLLQHGFTIDPQLSNNDYFIHKAVENGHLRIVEILLKLGTDVNMEKKETGLVLLHVACLNKHLKIAEILINYQADVNIIVDEKSIHDPKEFTKLNEKTCLYIAVDNLDVKMTKLLLYNGAYLNNDPSFFEIAELAMRDKEIFEELLKRGADVNAVNNKRETLLHRCALFENCHKNNKYDDQLALAPSLLRRGANINAQSLDGNTPLFGAITYQNFELVKWLLEHNADARHKNKYDNNALHIVAKEVIDSKFVRILLKYNTDINATNNNGFTPLYIASRCGNSNVVDVLLDHNADVNSVDMDGKTPLIIACIEQYPLIVESLLKKGADPNVKDKYSTTPLHHACENWFDDCTLDTIKFLLQHNANINAVNQQGQTPLFNACEDGELETIKLLLDNNADVNHADSKGTTPIWFAATELWNCSEIMKLLLEYNAKVHFTNRKKKPLIHLVAEHNYLEIIETLAKLHVNFNSVDKRGRTALHFAIEKGHLKMVESLLKYGANINIVNKKRQSALRLAVTRLDEIQVELDDIDENSDFYDYYSRRGNSDDSLSEYIKRMNFSRDHIYTYRGIIKILKEHITKLKCAKLKVNRQNMDILNEDSESDSDDDDDSNEDVPEGNTLGLECDCEAEIEQMRMERIGNTDITFYDLLTKSIHFLSRYVKNENVRQTLELDIYSTKFPLYINILKSRFAEGLLRRRLLISSLKYFDSNIIQGLPPNCIDTVFSFLNTKDLKMLIRAVRPSRK